MNYKLTQQFALINHRVYKCGIPEAIAHEASDVCRVVPILTAGAGAHGIRGAKAGVRERAVQRAGTLEAVLTCNAIAKTLSAERLEPHLALSVKPRLLVTYSRLLVPSQHPRKRPQFHVW